MDESGTRLGVVVVDEADLDNSLDNLISEAVSLARTGLADPEIPPPASDPALEQDALWRYVYDAEGRQIERVERATGAVTTYEWDAFDQLRRIVHPDGAETTFAYDGLGRRIEAVHRGEVHRFVFDGEVVRMTFDGANQLTAWRATDATGKLHAEYDPVSGIVRDALLDQLGTRVAWAEPGGIDLSVRDSFGNPLSVPDTFEPSALTWHTQDPTGLIFARARYLDPETGRFLSEDPVPGRNAYVYAENDPLNRWDPQGLSAVESATLRKRVGLSTIGGARQTGIRIACILYTAAEIVGLIEVSTVTEIVVTGVCAANEVGRPGRCFPAGTRVSVPAGSVPIETVRAGDQVLSWVGPPGEWRDVVGPEASAGVWVLGSSQWGTLLRTLETGQRFLEGRQVLEARRRDGGIQVRATGQELSTVEAVHERVAPDLLDAVFALESGEEVGVTATPDHPFYVPAHGGYIDLEHLELGAKLVLQNGEAARLVSNAWVEGPVQVFNLEVDPHHNYFTLGAPVAADVPGLPSEGECLPAFQVHNGKYGKPPRKVKRKPPLELVRCDQKVCLAACEGGYADISSFCASISDGPTRAACRRAAGLFSEPACKGFCYGFCQ